MLLPFSPRLDIPTSVRIALFYVSQTPGPNRHPLELPNDVKLYIRIQITDLDPEKVDIMDAIDLQNPQPDEHFLNADYLYVQPDPNSCKPDVIIYDFATFSKV